MSLSEICVTEVKNSEVCRRSGVIDGLLRHEPLSALSGFMNNRCINMFQTHSTSSRCENDPVLVFKTKCIKNCAKTKSAPVI